MICVNDVGCETGCRVSYQRSMEMKYTKCLWVVFLLALGCSPGATERLGAAGERCGSNSDCRETLICNGVCLEPEQVSSSGDDPMDSTGSGEPGTEGFDVVCDQMCDVFEECGFAERDACNDVCINQYQYRPEFAQCLSELDCAELAAMEVCFEPEQQLEWCYQSCKRLLSCEESTDRCDAQSLDDLVLDCSTYCETDPDVQSYFIALGDFPCELLVNGIDVFFVLDDVCGG